MQPNDSTGFSLVELSIVLVILGLLVGGILAGQSLIHASELRSVGVDITKYETAMLTFKDRYFGLPGDIGNATSIWSGTANGDTNGQLNEPYRFWQQLSLAGLIEGNYTGTASTPNVTVAGTNVPALRFKDTLVQNEYKVTSAFARNTLYFGSGSSSTGGNPWAGGFIAPEIWNIDTKTDDGAPNSGRLIVVAGNGYSTTLCFSGGVYALAANTAACYARWLM